MNFAVYQMPILFDSTIISEWLMSKQAHHFNRSFLKSKHSDEFLKTVLLTKLENSRFFKIPHPKPSTEGAMRNITAAELQLSRLTAPNLVNKLLSVKHLRLPLRDRPERYSKQFLSSNSATKLKLVIRLCSLFESLITARRACDFKDSFTKVIVNLKSKKNMLLGAWRRLSNVEMTIAKITKTCHYHSLPNGKAIDGWQIDNHTFTRIYGA
jgi:hypothetical protein